MQYIITLVMVSIAITPVLYAAYKSTRTNTVHTCPMAECAHDGSVEYVLTNSQIQEMVKPIMYDQDGYFFTPDTYPNNYKEMNK